MKKLIIILLLSVPFTTLAQENFIGKSRGEVKYHFIREVVPLYLTEDSGGLITDEYKDGDYADMTFFFDKTNICEKELAVESMSRMMDIKENLENNWIQLEENVWTNRARTVKMRLTIVEEVRRIYITYVTFSKDL